MSVVQLELDLWQQLAIAEDNLEQTNVEQLCLGLDLMLTQVSPKQQLATAGEAFLQIAEVFSRRADVLLNDWKQAHSEEGPILELDELEGLVRQSMVFELDDLMAEPEPVTRRSFPKESIDSRVEIVEKEVLLKELESELRETEDVLAVIEEESVSDWVDEIAGIISVRDRIALLELREAVGLSIGKVWLGLLLGGFELHQVGNEFYDGKITASLSGSRA